MQTWYPYAGNAYTKSSVTYGTDFPWRGVLHSTEGASVAGALAAYKSTGSMPHFTVGPDGSVKQHIAIDQYATALQHISGTVETNRARAVQIEIVGFAVGASSLPLTQMCALRSLMMWIEGQTGIKPVAPEFKPYPASYGLTNGVRMHGEWKTFNGWCGHQHVPMNMHGDPGALDMQYLLQRNPVAATTTEQDEDMDFRMSIRYGADAGFGLTTVNAKGEVQNYGTNYLGGIPNLPAEARKDIGDIVAITKLSTRPQDGYRLWDAKGNGYKFDQDEADKLRKLGLL